MAYIGDLSSYMQTNGINPDLKVKKSSNTDIGLDMTGFLQLMIAQFQNQSIDDTADTSEMINQMVQMQMIQALVNMTDASLMSYSASLVGKEVTIGLYDEYGNLSQVVGTVTGTGTYGGEQVIFIDDKYYYMSQIMAVGRIPSNVESGNKVENDQNPEGNTDIPPVEPDEGTDGSTDVPEVNPDPAL